MCTLMLCFRGTLAVHDLTIGNGCHLYLGPSGTSRGTETHGDVGIYGFDSLTVNGGGEVTMTPGKSRSDLIQLVLRSSDYVKGI